MKRQFASIVRKLAALGVCTGAVASALEVDDTSNSVFDLYFFGNDEVGLFGTPSGIEWNDALRSNRGHVEDSATYYWNDAMKQAMVNAVTTWTNAISTPYDTEKHARKLRIGFFLDDGSTSGGVMSKSMAGYAATQTVTTRFEAEYGSQANIYSVAEWAWRDNNETAYYNPSWVTSGSYWETNILSAADNSIDMAIVLNPLSLTIVTDANGLDTYVQTARTLEQMQNIATHEIGHGMGVDSRLYTQRYDASGNSQAVLSGYVSTWDSLLMLDGNFLVTLQDGQIDARHETLAALQAAGWECAEGLDPTDPASYTYNEIQYDPDRWLSLGGEVGVFISAVPLEGDTMEHLTAMNGDNLLGPGGTSYSNFSATDLRALELLGWSVNRDYVPEPATSTLSLLALAALAARRRRGHSSY